MFTEDILNTMFYLIVILWGIPTIYFGTNTELSSKEMKSYAFKIYPSMLFLVLLITILLYGVNDTKKAISYAFGEVIFFIFYGFIIAAFFLFLLFWFLGGWSWPIKVIKEIIKRKKQ